MELSWSTFVLEIVNFVVLVWILKRFLYKPVLEVIARRRADIEKTVADATALETDAKAMRDRYENRLAEWELEREKARDELAREIDTERAARMSELRTALEREREQAKAAQNRQLEDTRHRLEEAALTQGARFTGRLLEQLAGPDLDGRLFELLLEELSSLSAERFEDLGVGPGGDQPRDAILVSSAFTLSDEQRRRLNEVLTKVPGTAGPVKFQHDQSLLAGLRVTMGAVVLGMNLKDELDGFVRSAHGDD